VCWLVTEWARLRWWMCWQDVAADSCQMQ
jgi:hypothetical protein